MYRKKNKILRQASLVLGLIFSISIQADSSLDKSINKHQNTFENAAMQIWEWAEVGYQEYKSSELLKKELMESRFSLATSQIEDTSIFKKIKKQIAQANTVLNQKKREDMMKADNNE